MDIRAHVVALNEKRAKAWEQGKALLLAASDNKRDMTPEERQSFDRIQVEIDELDAEIRRFVAGETREREAAELREAQERAYGPLNEKPPALIDPNEALRAFLRGGPGNVVTEDGRRAFEVDIRGARKERELLRSGASYDEVRALAWDTGSSGSLVPTTLARSLYEYLEASVAMLRMPTTKVNTSSGEAMQFPRVAAHAIATQVIAQGTAIGGTDPTFARMQLDAYKYGQLVRVASEVLSDSAVDIGSFLGRDIGRGIGRILDADLVVGTGTNEPNGLMTAVAGSGTIATGGSLITPTVEKLIDLQYSVVDEYRNMPSCAWLMNDSTAGTLRKLRDGAGGTVGAFLWQPSLTNGVIGGQPDLFLGKPVYTDPNVAAQGSNAKSIAFGDMSAYYVRTVGNPVIESDNSRYFDTDEVAFRGKWRADGDLIDSNAVNIIKQSV